MSKRTSKMPYLSSGPGQVRKHQQSRDKRCGSATPPRCPIRGRQDIACHIEFCLLNMGSATPNACPSALASICSSVWCALLEGLAALSSVVALRVSVSPEEEDSADPPSAGSSPSGMDGSRGCFFFFVPFLSQMRNRSKVDGVRDESVQLNVYRKLRLTT